MGQSPPSSCYNILLCIVITILVLMTQYSYATLYTNSRWIVNEGGQRVKLSCVNWVSHLEVMVAEGLSKQPIDTISKSITNMGFNCVRLTWPLFLFTNDSLATLTVRQSFNNLGLVESIAGLQTNNPSILDLSLLRAYQVHTYSSYFQFIIYANNINEFI